MDNSGGPFQDLRNEFGIPVRLFANPEVPVETAAREELQQFLQLQATVEEIQAFDPDFFGDEAAGIEQVAITPDFHKGAGIPIGTVTKTKGFVAPHAMGKDINCGMRLMLTDWSGSDIREHQTEIERKIRHVYFEGGRALSIDRIQKEALLKQGLTGLLETASRRGDAGIWRYFRPEEQAADLHRVMQQGSLPTDEIFEGLHNYINHSHVSYDSQLGSIGGGNHFVEVQRVDKILDGAIAYAWGLRPGQVVVMVHTGSVSVGHPASGYIQSVLRSIYPAGLRLPANRILPLPVQGKYATQWRKFKAALHNAGNFAFANRLFLGLMLRKVFEEVLGDREMRLLYDAGHNFLWEQSAAEGGGFVHRKGATPARGPGSMSGTPFEWTGEPVLIPGSMGASSFILAGRGLSESLASASHGAGRALSRGRSMQQDQAAFDDLIRRFSIVTPIDPKAPQFRGRRDILQKWQDEIKQEAPWAFKAIQPIIQSQVAAGMVAAVAETTPILTVKG